MKIITIYEDTWCQGCSRTTIHEIYMSGTTDRRRVTVIKKCLHCLRAKGRIC